LNDWHKAGWLTPHKPTRDEIRALLAVADRDLKDSDVRGLSADTQLGLAYNAALQIATAALAASGFRASRDSKHYRTIESLALTVGLDRTVIRKFDAFRKKRNVADYEMAGMSSEDDAGEMKDLARQLRREADAWLKRRHSGLL
jgi:hypothetical protein